MLNTIDVSTLKDLKLKSALCTTHGGVKRDLKRYDEALGLGEQAHLFTPQDFRPCTLLGAVNMEIGHYDLGQSSIGKLLNEVIAKSQWMMNYEAFLCVPRNQSKRPYATICSRWTPSVIVGRKNSLAISEPFVTFYSNIF
jgi:hypothetical protein